MRSAVLNRQLGLRGITDKPVSSPLDATHSTHLIHRHYGASPSLASAGEGLHVTQQRQETAKCKQSEQSGLAARLVVAQHVMGWKHVFSGWIESPDETGWRPVSWPRIVAGQLWAGAAPYWHWSVRQAMDTISRWRAPPRSTSHLLNDTQSTNLDAQCPTLIAEHIEFASNVARRQ